MLHFFTQATAATEPALDRESEYARVDKGRIRGGGTPRANRLYSLTTDGRVATQSGLYELAASGPEPVELYELAASNAALSPEAARMDASDDVDLGSARRLRESLRQTQREAEDKVGTLVQAGYSVGAGWVQLR